MKVLEIQPILANIRQFFQVILTIFTGAEGLVDFHLVGRPTGRLCQLVDMLREVDLSTPTRRLPTGRQGYKFSQLSESFSSSTAIKLLYNSSISV